MYHLAGLVSKRVSEAIMPVLCYCVAAVRLKQRAVVGLEMYYGDNRDDTHMFQLIKAHDVAQHVRRQQVLDVIHYSA